MVNEPGDNAPARRGSGIFHREAGCGQPLKGGRTGRGADPGEDRLGGPSPGEEGLARA